MIKAEQKSLIAFFLDTARRFLDHELLKIRKKSQNTVASYRASLNIYIGFLEEVRGIRRKHICFNNLDGKNLKECFVWMASRKPRRPSTQKNNTSCTPRFFRSLSIPSQNREDSFAPTMTL